MSTEPAYSFEHRFEDTSEGGHDTWIVIKNDRGAGDPIATCHSPADALVIADALNLAAGRNPASRMADEDLLRAYQATDGKPGNPEADVLLAEIERRGLDL